MEKKSLKVKHSLAPPIIVVVLMQIPLISFLLIALPRIYDTLNIESIVLIIIILGLVVDVYLSISHIYRKSRSYYLIKKSSVLYVIKRLLFTRKYYYTLNENVDFRLKRNIWGRLLNFGSIRVIENESDEKVILKLVHAPDKVLASLVKSISSIREQKYG